MCSKPQEAVCLIQLSFLLNGLTLGMIAESQLQELVRFSDNFSDSGRVLFQSLKFFMLSYDVAEFILFFYRKEA